MQPSQAGQPKLDREDEHLRLNGGPIGMSVPSSHATQGLKHRLAEHGFVANADYEYPVRCFLSAHLEHLRCLNIEGDSGRRKTAFAHALAQALGIAHVRYHEFTEHRPSPPPVRIEPPPVQGSEVAPGEPPVEAFVQTIGEACALSEGDPTVLILDQLQLAPFHRHLQIGEFIRTCKWSVGDMQLQANRQYLNVFLISEAPLYHSLQQLSFNLWIAAHAQPTLRPSPAELGLDAAAEPLLEGLAELFSHLEVTPTWPEYQRLMHDIHVNVHSLEHLKTSIYGWIEGVERRTLYSAAIHEVLATRLGPLLRDYLDVPMTD